MPDGREGAGATHPAAARAAARDPVAEEAATVAVAVEEMGTEMDTAQEVGKARVGLEVVEAIGRMEAATSDAGQGEKGAVPEKVVPQGKDAAETAINLAPCGICSGNRTAIC